MYETLELCVEHGGELKCFPAVFSQYGFSYRITIDIKGTVVIFEPDEEREWRARIEDGTPTKEATELIPLVAEKLKELL